MLVANPVYSTYTRGGSNNVHKFERYLNMRPSTATMYGPIQFGPTPIMMFHPSAKWTPGSPSSLIGYGTILDPAPQRIIAKRIVLTGHPFKIHKRGAVIRFLFYTREDIEYFKPVQLATKHGRIGHMKEALGTHGYIKCIFDGPIKQHDTVMMHLYKRVFPKKQAQMYVRDVSSKDMELTQVENDDIEMGN